MNNLEPACARAALGLNMSQKLVASLNMNNREPKIRVLLFDEHPVFRMGLTGFLSGEAKLDVVAETSTAAEVTDILDSQVVDVLLVDFCLGTGRGADFIRKIRNGYPQVKVLVMTMFDEQDQLASAMLAGAHGSITKTQSPRHWVQLISQTVQPRPHLSVAQ
jgi:DNA-binding NarL/FixJ family response regulator